MKIIINHDTVYAFATQRNATQRNATQRNATQRNSITLNFLKNNLIINLINYFLILYPFLSDTLTLTTYWERRNPILL